MTSLELASKDFTTTIQNTITTATYNSTNYGNGTKAKEALIRSQTLIQIFHTSLKQIIYNKLIQTGKTSLIQWGIYPPMNQTQPELKIYGYFKGKDQDLTFLRDDFIPEYIDHLNKEDPVGFKASNQSLICGIRSQMSSVDKNFDTLMERAIAESINLRLRLPNVTLGELYIIPIQELDINQSNLNIFKTINKKVDITKFIRQFYTTTKGNHITNPQTNICLVDSACLLIIDLDSNGTIIKNSNELMNYGYTKEICQMFELLQPEGFEDRLINAYIRNNNL